MLFYGLDDNGRAKPARIDNDRSLIVTLNTHGIWYMPNVTQVNEFGIATNATTVLYTVPVGKTAFISSVIAAARNSTTGTSVPRLDFRNSTSSAIWRMSFQLNADSVLSNTATFNPPFMLLPGYDVVLVSSAANAPIQGSIHGWTI